MLAVVDYGRGNLFSIAQALDKIGVPHEITGEPARIARADGLILPGVGAFGDAMIELDRRGLIAPLRRVAAENRPFLGICVGCQVLFDHGREFGEHGGLGLLRGTVQRLAEPDPADGAWRIPNVGWRALTARRPGSLFADAEAAAGEAAGPATEAMVYFVHSYAMSVDDPEVVAASFSFAGRQVPAAVQVGNLIGTQFHVERSGAVGLELLRRFTALVH